jgi:phenylacetic acid degradation operon negative regulatory protein
MVRQGWLHPLRLSSGPGYLITQRAAHRLDEAAERIYRTNPKPWDGTFDLFIADAPVPRPHRQRIANNLAYLGYGSIGEATWVATKPSPEADAVLTDAGVRFQRFTANHASGIRGATTLVSQAWDLERIGREYREFVISMRPMVDRVDANSDLKAAYTARFRLVHAWRTFLFRDPALPPDLLPTRWPGHDAAEFFDLHAGRLRPAADEFVERCLTLVKGVQP